VKVNKTKKPLAKGQLWKTPIADIEIVGLGERLIHYRVTNRLGRALVSEQISGIEPMANYLALNSAKLISDPARN
jgi:hypothetical protein